MKYFKPSKRVLRFFSASLILIGFIYSCKKEQSTKDLKPNQTSIQMQKWLSNQKKDSLIALTVNSLLSQADWETAHSVTIDSGKTYEIVKLKTTATLFDDADKTQQRYLTLVTANSDTTGYIYELFGNKEEIENTDDMSIKGFNTKNIPGLTGSITLYSWKNRIQSSKNYVNGINTQTFKLVTGSAPSKGTQDISKLKPNSCIAWYWSLYDGTGQLVSTTYLYTTCDCGEEPYSYRDRKGIMQLKSNCGGGGGGSTGTGAAAPNVYDSVANPCLHAMVNATMGANVNTQISSLIASVFGVSPQVNIYYFDVTTLPSGVEGHTNSFNLDVEGNINIRIDLNQNSLPNASQQYIATVIMHEAMHAYLMANGVPDFLQHEDIAKTYVTKLAASLQQMFPGINSSDATNLALGGLQTTDTFKNTIANDLQLTGSFEATQMAYSIGSSGARCN